MIDSGHEIWMRHALDLARQAEVAGEVPVGCVIVAAGEIIGKGRNSPIERLDPTAHAEMLALREAAFALGNYRMGDATMYCLRFGGVRSKFQIADSPLLNHRVEIIEGVLGAESTALLQQFFNARRFS
jgi:tRNA(adenine34) deaminase